jgi:small subunit ribosomal protein S16
LLRRSLITGSNAGKLNRPEIKQGPAVAVDFSELILRGGSKKQMALRIRLARFGAKKRPFYRIVVANSEAPRDGRFLEIIGTYDPRQDPAAVTVKEEQLSLWMSRGATPTDTVASLLKKRPQSPPEA